VGNSFLSLARTCSDIPAPAERRRRLLVRYGEKKIDANSTIVPNNGHALEGNVCALALLFHQPPEELVCQFRAIVQVQHLNGDGGEDDEKEVSKRWTRGKRTWRLRALRRMRIT